jgi:hypothetical protein
MHEKNKNYFKILVGIHQLQHLWVEGRILLKLILKCRLLGYELISSGA